MNIGIAVSGTGGHIYPGISIGQLLAKKGNNIVFFCAPTETTKSILSGYDFAAFEINISGWKNRSIFSLLKFFIQFFAAFFKAIYFIKKQKLDVVIGMGGYLAIPVILAAKVLRKKTIIQEQNFYPGLANKFLHLVADKTAIGFVESSKYFKNKSKVFFTGNPIRKEFYDGILPEIAKAHFNIESEKKVIFIFGGSQGANFLNKIIFEVLNDLNSLENEISIIHITGEKDFDDIKQKYAATNFEAKVFKYMSDIYMAYFASDLIISRAGASTITEILVTAKPSILIPYPFATEDHQTKNAALLEKNGVAALHQEKNFDKIKFVTDIKKILASPENIRKKFDNFREYEDLKFDENLCEIVLS